jgi:hypothetical protein
VFAFPGGVRWDFKRGKVPQRCQFGFLITRTDYRPFYLSFRPNLESILRDTLKSALQLTSRPQTVTFDPTIAPYGNQQTVVSDRLGLLKGKIHSLIEPFEVRISHPAISALDSLHHNQPRHDLEPAKHESDGKLPTGMTEPALDSVDSTEPVKTVIQAGKPLAEVDIEALNFDDPPRPKVVASSVGYFLNLGLFQSRWRQESTGCCRSSRTWSESAFSVGDGLRIQGSTNADRYRGFYIVIGLFDTDSAIPLEKLIEIEEDESIGRRLRLGIVALRGFRSFLSLKTVSGFAVYKVSILYPISTPFSPHDSFLTKSAFLSPT